MLSTITLTIVSLALVAHLIISDRVCSQYGKYESGFRTDLGMPPHAVAVDSLMLTYFCPGTRGRKAVHRRAVETVLWLPGLFRERHHVPRLQSQRAPIRWLP